MEKAYIEIDASPWLTCDGDIEVGVYIGEETCEPSYTSKVSLKELVDRELEGMILDVIPGSGDTKSGCIAEYHKEDVKRLLESF